MKFLISPKIIKKQLLEYQSTFDMAVPVLPTQSFQQEIQFDLKRVSNCHFHSPKFNAIYAVGTLEVILTCDGTEDTTKILCALTLLRIMEEKKKREREKDKLRKSALLFLYKSN